jgi:hypothetical protein
VLPAALDLEAAEHLDKRIRTMADSARKQLTVVASLLEKAMSGRIDEVLGFPSWTAYLADALGGQLQLQPDTRVELVQYLAGEGMSVRAIASVAGVSKSTVSNDIAQVSNDWTPQPDSGVQPVDTSPDTADGATVEPQPAEPASVTGLDGKTYTKPKPKPKGDKPRRRPHVRKGFEHMALQVGGWADGLRDMDPAELAVDAEVQKEIDTVVEGIAAIRKFLDGVKPARKAQPLTAFRWKAKELTPIIADLEALTKDPRWEKARGRFNDKDRVALDTHIAALQELRAAGDDAEVAR